MRTHHRRPRTLADILTGVATAFGLELGDAEAPDATAAWRSWLSQRRLLIVLDDARDESVVRALLPGHGPSRIVVTSRFRLSGLDNVRRVEPGALSTSEAVELTAKIAGVGAVLGDRTEIVRQIAHCGQSPLAVRILAGRLQQLGGSPVRAGGRDLLDQLVLGDLSLANRYREHCEELPARDLRVLEALVAHARPPFNRMAIAASMPAPAAETDRAIESLIEANLLVLPDDLLALPDDEVTGHAESYDMPVLAYEYARSRLASRSPGTAS